MYTANTNQITHVGKAVHAAITQRHHFSRGWNNLLLRPLARDANGGECVLGYVNDGLAGACVVLIFKGV